MGKKLFYVASVVIVYVLLIIGIARCDVGINVFTTWQEMPKGMSPTGGIVSVFINPDQNGEVKQVIALSTYFKRIKSVVMFHITNYYYKIGEIEYVFKFNHSTDSFEQVLPRSVKKD